MVKLLKQKKTEAGAYLYQIPHIVESEAGVKALISKFNLSESLSELPKISKNDPAINSTLFFEKNPEYSDKSLVGKLIRIERIGEAHFWRLVSSEVVESVEEEENTDE
jgi:DNA-directed RNA polymerase subunit H (RpoH/RPB5)